MTSHLLRRYGGDSYAEFSGEAAAHAAHPVVAQQLAHRSVRSFLDDEVTAGELEVVLAAAQSASTSSNLQPWSVVAVRDAARRARLADLAGQQAFVAQAPLVLVWVADLGRARRLAGRAGARVEATEYLETTILGFVDASLAAQNALLAAESLGLGGVFVGGIRNRPLEVADELRLPEHTVATFGLALGRPDPTERADVKPRLPLAAVLHHEQYDAPAADAHVEAYDRSLRAYNERFGLAGTWSDRILARLKGPSSMSGRHEIRAHLAARGLPSR